MPPGTLLPWTYYLLGPDNAQLAVWHGMQGQLCDGSDENTVRMWPIEYSSYSAGGRIIMRPDGRKEYVITNHLGSTAAVVELGTATVVAHQYTTSFGEPLSIKGAVDTDRARTGFIGRETDAEHNLGAFGARLYSSEYGRFMAVDKLWEEFEWITPYAYAENSPLRLKDPSGEVPIDTFWDGLNVVVDFGRVVYHTFTGNTSKAKEAAKDLAADGLALAIPYVPAGLTKLRHVDDAVDAVKTADKAADATKAGRKGAEGADQVGKGRSANSLRPDASAAGAHTVVKKGADGTVSNYATYMPNKNNPTGFQEVKRVDVKGKRHTNPDGTQVPTPHVKESGKKGVRPANKEELP